MCISCGAGRWSSTVAANSIDVCELCRKGTYGEAVSAKSILECLECEKGRYSSVLGATSSDVCVMCEKGKWSDTHAASSDKACQSCPAGRFGEMQGQISIYSCQPCPVGQYNGEIGSTASSQCVDCPVVHGNVRVPSTAVITDVKEGGAVNVSQCTCQRGYYFRNDHLFGCDACTEGMECSSTAGRIEGMVPPKAGYWVSTTNDSIFHKCLNAAACLGGNITQTVNETIVSTYCATGYTGKLCAECETKYVLSSFGQSCQQCIVSPILQTLVIVAFTFMAIFIVWFLQDSNKHGRDDTKAKPSSVTLRILVNHCQTLLLVGGLQNHGPELYREIITAPAAVAEGGIVSSLNGFVECALDLNFFQRTYIVATLPFISFFVACFVYFCIRSLIDCCDESKRTIIRKNENENVINYEENPIQNKDITQKQKKKQIKYNPCSKDNFNTVSKGMIRVGAVSMFLIHSSVVDQLLSALESYSKKIEVRLILLTLTQLLLLRLLRTNIHFLLSVLFLPVGEILFEKFYELFVHGR